MAIRALKPVRKYRGEIREWITACLHYCQVLERFDSAHPPGTFMTPVERINFDAVILDCQRYLTQKVNV
jgi:hypothetical protein